MDTPDSPDQHPLYEGRYQLGAALGQGPVGVVYRAVDTRSGRPCALKRLHAPGHDPALMSVVQREAAAAWALGHPAIIAAHDSGVDQEGRLYLVSDLIEGESLKAQLGRGSGTLTVTQALLLLEPVCAALEVAHRAGLSHGGLRPANILTTPAGGTFLTDFGVAHLGLRGAFSESLCYLPPEVYRDEVRGPTPAGDVFALGAVLFECLTGQPLFFATTAAAATFRICQAPLPTQQSAPGLPQGVYDLLAMACARSLDDRFAEPRSFLRALSAVAGAGVQSRMTSLENRLPRPLARTAADRDDDTQAQGPAPAGPYTEPLPPPPPAVAPSHAPEQTAMYILPEGVSDDMLVADDEPLGPGGPVAREAQQGAPGKPARPVGSGPQGGHTALYVPIPMADGPPPVAAAAPAPAPRAPAADYRRHDPSRRNRFARSRPPKAPAVDPQRRVIWGRVPTPAGKPASAQPLSSAATPVPRASRASIQPVVLEETLQSVPASGPRSSRVGIEPVAPLPTTAAIPTLTAQSDTAPMVPLPPPGPHRSAARSLILASLAALIVGVGAAGVMLGLHLPRGAASPAIGAPAAPRPAPQSSSATIAAPPVPAAAPRQAAKAAPGQQPAKLYDDFVRAAERGDVDGAIALYRDLPADAPSRAQGQARYEALRQRFEQAHLQLAAAAQRGRLCDVVQQQLDQLQSVAERDGPVVRDAQKLLRRCHAPNRGRTRRAQRGAVEATGDDLAPPLF